MRTTAEVDLEIARRSAETLDRRIADAHEALRLAGIEHKRAEAERLRSVFEETARQALARMSVDARALIRAWAEAELAIRAARVIQGAGGPDIPGAEEFRSVHWGVDREVKRTRITRWLRPGTQEPFDDEVDREIVYRDGGGFLRNSYMSGGGRDIAERGIFERVTYEKATPAIFMPSLIESLCVPALVGGQAPGWSPVDDRGDPNDILARLAELEGPAAERKPELRIVDTFVHLVGAEAAAASA